MKRQQAVVMKEQVSQTCVTPGGPLVSAISSLFRCRPENTSQNLPLNSLKEYSYHKSGQMPDHLKITQILP